MSHDIEQRPCLVVGAGIGGLSAALALARKGTPVEVYERRPDETVALAGTGMTIWSNATTALGSLGLADELKNAGEVIKRARHVDAKDDVVFETDVAGLEWPGSVPSLSIARGALVRVLLEACQDAGVPVHFGVRCTGYTSDSSGVALQLADGAEVSGEAVIGADGVGSTIRAQVVGDGAPTYYGITVWRGLSESSGGLEKGVAHMFQTRESSGLAGMAWHVGDDRVAWTIGVKSPPGEKDPPGTLKDRVLDLIQNVEGQPRRYVELTDPAEIVRVDLYMRESTQWGAGRATLLGDAGHGMPTVLGQGACQAVEDGIVLGQCLLAETDVESGLRRYEQQRDERVRWVRSQVDKLARMQQLSHPVALRIRDFAARHVAARLQPRMWSGLLQPPVDTGNGIPKAAGNGR